MSVPPTDPNRQLQQSGAASPSGPPVVATIRERLPKDVEKRADDLANAMLRALEEERRRQTNPPTNR